MTREHLCRGTGGKEELRRETGVAFVLPNGVVIGWIVKTYFILLFNVCSLVAAIIYKYCQ